MRENAYSAHFMGLKGTPFWTSDKIEWENYRLNGLTKFTDKYMTKWKEPTDNINSWQKLSDKDLQMKISYHPFCSYSV
jgi:hypothetical protein